MDVISAVRRIRGQDGYWTKHDILEAERYVIEAIKAGWKVVPPRSWHETYIWDSNVAKNIGLLCSMYGVQYDYDEYSYVFKAKCDDKVWVEICNKVNITPMIFNK